MEENNTNNHIGELKFFIVVILLVIGTFLSKCLVKENISTNKNNTSDIVVLSNVIPR